MSHKTEIEQRDLLSDIRILEKENELLMERAEEISLLQSAGDALYASSNRDAIVQNVLERLAIFLDIPFCAFCVREGDVLTAKNVYTLVSNSPQTENCIILSQELIKRTDKSPQFGSYADLTAEGFKIQIVGGSLSPQNIAIFRTSSVDYPALIFVFADQSERNDTLINRQKIIRAVLYKIVTRLDNLTLSDKLEKLNAELENRVSRRTAEFLESEERFRMVMEQSPNVVELYNLDGLQIAVNKAYVEMWGIKAADSVGKFNLFASKEVEAIGLLEHVKQAFAGETVVLPEYIFDPTGATETGRQDRVRWLNTKIYPLRDMDGNVKNIVITHEDITDKKLAANRLSESEARYRGLFETSIDGICILDAHGNFIDINPAAVKLMGYPRETLLKMAVQDVVEAEDREKSAYYMKKLHEEGFYQGYEGRVITQTGEIRYIEVSSIAIYENEAIVGSHDILRDVTERLLSERKLAANLAEKEILLQEIQHRTKNNMMVIIALLNMQAREVNNPELDVAFKITQDRIYAMSLVYDHLQKSDNFAAIDLNLYITSLSQKLHTSGLSNPGRIKFVLSCESIPISLTQAVPVGIVLNETITNALQHGFPNNGDGEISVIAEIIKPGRLKISVSDNGVGMPPDLINKTAGSLGLRIVDMLVGDQLDGKHIMKSDHGVSHFIEFDLM
ncbi:MAG: MEKHLA domain-containing protein [Candidatus Marinimicrobia bacterium]|nr:MEKHLA domain-containing protein [Candidatus Neomarinimicrobiota bacterium]